MKKKYALISALTIASIVLSAVGFVPFVQAAVAPNWNVTGNYVFDQQYNGTDNAHTVTLTQDGSGNVTGSGTSGAYTWVMDSGTVSGDTFDFTAHYTATADASTTVLNVMTTIAPDGTMTGTWSDNYPAVVDPRTGAWTTTGGAAVAIPAPSPSPSVSPSPSPATVTVTIDKYVDGVMATAANANSSSFPMTETLTATNFPGSNTFAYTLSPSGINSTNAYEAITSPLSSGANYTTNEITASTTGSVVGADCAAGQPYSLVGYSYGTTSLAAQMAAPTLTPPTFTNMTQDEYVIVWNHNCTTSGGSIGGTVTGGASATGTLAVTGVTVVKSTATADGTFANGWNYVFNITVPTDETNLSMKFADWMSTVGSTTIPVANNMRISSAQANNGGATVLLTAANTYSAPALHMTGDLSTTTPGLQVQVTVEVAIPSSTVNGSYTTSYGVQTLP